MGSLAELETQLLIAKELKYADNNDEIFSNIKSIQKLIQGLIKYLKGKLNSEQLLVNRERRKNA